MEEVKGSALDIIKLLMAIAVLVAGIWGFYHFEEDYMLWMRFLGLFAVVAVALAVSAWSTQGRAFLGFFSDARSEVRKVVWPTRAETVQTTLIILVVVILVGIMLSVVDLAFSKIVEWLVTPGA